MLIPTKTISEFVAALAQESNLPFAAVIEPDPDWEPISWKTVGKYRIPIFHELLALEQWFFEGIQAKGIAKQIELQMTLNGLLRDIKTEFGVESLNDARPILAKMLAPGEDAPEDEGKGKGKKSSALAIIPKNSEIEDFTFLHQDKFNQLIMLSNQSSGQLVERLFKVTFFMRQRWDKDWDFVNTAKLPVSSLNTLNDIIATEVAGGSIQAFSQPTPTGEMGEPSTTQPNLTGLDSTQTLGLAA